MADSRLRDALTAKQFITAPGIFDMITAKVADGLGFMALYGTGFGTVSSYLGVADAGIASYTDMVTRMGRYAQGCKTPVIADADTGYGGLLNVRHTVMGYEAAGIAAIQIEDQEVPKKCGHTPGRRVIPMRDMCLKIEVAVQARKSPDFLIIARTDAVAVEGLPRALDRARAYADAGADVLFVEAPRSRAHLAELAGALRGVAPLMANVVEGGDTPPVPTADLEAMGFGLVIFPGGIVRALAHTARDYYNSLARHGSNLPFAPRMFDFTGLNDLVGTPGMLALGRAYEGSA